MELMIKYYTLKLLKMIYPLWKRSKVVKGSFSVKIRQETKTTLHFSLDAIIFSAFQLKIVNTSVFQEVMFNEAIASDTRYHNSNNEKDDIFSEMLSTGTQLLAITQIQHKFLYSVVCPKILFNSV